MPEVEEKSSSELGGSKALHDMFSKTLEVIESCACQGLCYKCLLSFENQYHHQRIDRDMAISWLKGFIDANDWKAFNSPLTGRQVTNQFEDSALEQRYKSIMATSFHAVQGIGSIRVGSKEGRWVSEIDTKWSKDPFEVWHTPRDVVNLKKAYTKPDFTIRSVDGVLGYIYTDGADVHLAPAEERAPLLKDGWLRSQLDEKLGRTSHGLSRVLSISPQMLIDWQQWSSGFLSGSKMALSLLLEREVSIGGQSKKFHLLELAVLKCFGMPIAEPLDGILRDLRAAYVGAAFAQVLGSTDVVFYDAKNRLENLMKICMTINPDKGFGGLKFIKEGESGKFILATDKDLRTAPNGSLNQEYKASWELFWILWSVMPLGRVVLDKLPD
jgi:hypothetical protein